MADKKNKKGNTIELVTELVKPIAEDMGLTLWDVRFLKEGAQWYLRIFIDKDSGVTIEDCENLTRAVDQPLDELDPIEQNYILEVSSPGIERELILPEHFDAFLGAAVMIKLIRPDAGGQRDFSGTLVAHDKDTVTIVCDGNERVINKKDTVYIKLDDFEI
ncbi:MAG: ribosome maturation factor RimP [Clostridia bacterium]|nr:ribosome maturation factor RimP [Clostridia bacterium]